MDRIVIEGIEVWAHHGVLAHERDLGQRFVIDVMLEADLSAAVASDDLADTIDYGRVAADVHEAASAGPFQLIESVAGRVLDACFAHSAVAAAEVVVHKPGVPLTVPAREVRVMLRRERGS